MITQDTAKQAAASFVYDMKQYLGLSLDQIAQMLGPAEKDYNPAVGWVWDFSSKLGTVILSMHDGKLVSYFDDDELDGIDTIIKMDDAEREMKRFLVKYYPDFDEERFQQTRKELDEGSYEFEYEQRAMLGEHSIYHNYLSISVRSDIPRVVGFDRSALNFVRTTPPKISRDAAKRIAESLIREGGKIFNMSLYEYPTEEAKSSMTVWAVSVEYNYQGLESLELITLNADTGAEVEVDELEPEVEE